MMAPHLLHHYPYFIPVALQLLAVAAVLTSQSRFLQWLALLNFALFLVFWILLIIMSAPIRSAGALVLALLLLTYGSWRIVGGLLAKRRSYGDG